MKEVEYGEKEASEILRNIVKITDNKQYLTLILAGEDSTITVDSLKLLSTPFAQSYAIAKAYVINSLAQALMSNFYLKVLKPQNPVKFFKTQYEAELWLKSQ